MSTFNLSLAKEANDEDAAKAKPAVASKEYEKKMNPDTGKLEDVRVTEGGISINKDKAPIVKLDGPLGYIYTEKLNRLLTKESMTATAQGFELNDHGGPTQLPTGFVAVDNNEASLEVDDGEEGYMYVADGTTLTHEQYISAAESLMRTKRLNPTKPLGLGLVFTGKLTVSAESLVKSMHGMGVSIAFRAESIEDLALNMIRKKQGK